jgi:hypothetical protein
MNDNAKKYKISHPKVQKILNPNIIKSKNPSLKYAKLITPEWDEKQKIQLAQILQNLKYNQIVQYQDYIYWIEKNTICRKKLKIHPNKVKNPPY